MDLPRDLTTSRAETRQLSLLVQELTVRVAGQPVLEEVSLTVGPGEIVALLGRDGAGKTVCFEAIAGLTAIDRGRVLLNGANLTPLPADERALRGLSYLPEEVSIFRELTVAENIAIALEMMEQADLRAARLESILAAFKLAPMRDQVAGTLSGGERRRCELARAMATHPSVLMLDEPFRGLDPFGIEEVREAILELRDLRVGVLVSDYDLHDLLKMIDRAYVLHQGRLVFSGPPGELVTNAEVRRLYLGPTFAA